MPRPRKPTNILEFSGAYKKNPQRAGARANEPKPNGPLGDPPAHFKEPEREIWNEIAAELHPGTACRADRGDFEQLCIMAAKVRAQYAAGGPMAVDEKAVAACNRLRTAFGLNPAARSRVAAAKQDPAKEDSFAAV